VIRRAPAAPTSIRVRVLLALAAALAAPAASAAPADDHPPSPPRARPDYDGLPDPPPTGLEVAAWVPRVVLFPAWVVSEYVIRRPLGWLIVAAERGDWPSELISFFTFGTQNFGLVPTFYVDLGFRPTFGFYLFWDQAGHPAHSLRARASGTADGFALSLADRWQTDAAGSRFQAQAGATLSPDRAFYGIGPRTLDADVARYGLLTYGGSVAFDWHVVQGVRVLTEVGVRRMTFRDPKCCGEIPVANLPESPPGFPGGYTAFTQHLEAAFDSRPPRPAAQTGLRLRLAGDHGHDLDAGADWISATGTVGGFWDVAGSGRILGITVTAALAEPLSGAIPFPELIAFGGNGLAMPGLRADRLLGQSALSASLRYQWPIWAFASGVLQVELGNVFGPGFEGLDTDLLRLSVAGGVRTAGSPDHALQILVGFGTETFAQGAALTSVRLAIGGTYGF
jgi:hypothetical protein